MDKEQAIRATRNGAIAAAISGTATVAITLFAIYGTDDSRLSFWDDPFIFFDVVLIYALGYGVYRKSRASAILLFVYFVVARIYLVAETGSISGLGTALIFLYFYGKAIQGAFVYHTIEKQSNPSYRSISKTAIFVGAPFGAIALALVLFSVLTITNILPSTEVQTGNEIWQSDKAKLIENNIIRPNDTIRYFYSEGFISILEGGSILTEKEVIAYAGYDGNESWVYRMKFEDIARVTMETEGDLINNSVYRVMGIEEDDWILLLLSTENEGDKKFIEALEASIKDSRSDEYRFD